jgi:hypothetical protein
MPINLRDIPDAVQSYLNTQVAVSIAQLAPSSGSSINPGESFEVHLQASNANQSAGGVALKNLKYRISVDNATVAKLVVPGNAYIRATDLAGNDLNGNQEVGAMIVHNMLADELAVGGTSTLVINAKAAGAASGGATTVRARVLADVDLDALFPQGEDTAAATRSLTVVG